MMIAKDFQAPDCQSGLVIRPRLTDLFSCETKKTLQLITAPAGYGKSVLAAQSLAHNRHLSWYSIEDFDNDPEQFFASFILATKIASKRPFPNTETLLQTSSYTIKKLLSTFSAEFSVVTTPCTLVLDNYHKISHKKIHEFIRELLIQQPHFLTLTILSRDIPPYNLAQLKLTGKLLHINKMQLAFTQQETEQYIDTRYAGLRLETKKITQLHHYSKGWISSLILVLETAKDDHALLNLINKGSTHLSFPSIDQYIEDEILQNLSTSALSFCMKLSLLKLFTEKQAAIVVERQKSRQNLEELINSELLSVVNTEKNQFSFHPLVREYLNIRRLKHAPKHEEALIQVVIEAYLAEECIAEALELIIINNQQDQLIKTLEQFGWSLLNQFDLTPLSDAFQTLSHQQISQHSKIGLLAAWLAHIKGEPEQAHSIVAQSGHWLDTIESEPEKSELNGEINVLKAQLALSENQPEVALTYAESALIYLDHASYRGRSIATSIVGEIHHVNGRLEQALSLMQQTERFARQHKLIPQTTWALIQQSEIYLTRGMLSVSEELLNKTDDIICQNHLFHLPFYPMLVSLQIDLYLERRQFRQAIEAGAKALTNIGDIHQSKDMIYASLAKIDMSQQRWSNCSETLANLSLDNAHYPYSCWSAHVAEARLYFWQHTNNDVALNHWLHQTVEPDSGHNHLTQCQLRNLALANLIQGDYDKSEHLLNLSIRDAQNSHLILDLYRSYALAAYLYHCQNKKNQARTSLLNSLSLSAEYKVHGYYYLTGKWILTYLSDIAGSNQLSRTESWHVSKLKDDMTTYYLAIEESSYCSVDNLISQITTYQIEQGNPVTPREAQIFSLIYTGWKNDQIAEYCKVAPSTIKSHIRNLYQKLSVSNRRQAKALATQLIER